MVKYTREPLFKNVRRRTWRAVCWSRGRWVSEALDSLEPSVSAGTFSSLELLLGTIRGRGTAWRFDLRCVVSWSFQMLSAVMTEVWEPTNTDFLQVCQAAARNLPSSGDP